MHKVDLITRSYHISQETVFNILNYKLTSIDSSQTYSTSTLKSFHVHYLIWSTQQQTGIIILILQFQIWNFWKINLIAQSQKDVWR